MAEIFYSTRNVFTEGIRRMPGCRVTRFGGKEYVDPGDFERMHEVGINAFREESDAIKAAIVMAYQELDIMKEKRSVIESLLCLWGDRQ